MSPPSSPFALALCQPGMEKWLKAEMLRLRPDLKSAFQRPGVVTFKATGPEFSPNDAPPAIFARAWACSHGPASVAAEIVQVARAVGAGAVFLGARDAGVPGDVPDARQAAVNADVDSWRAKLLATRAFPAHQPVNGECVLDVITFPGEPVMVGWHVHGPRRHAGPCGRYDYPVPDDVPSRAWRRTVEGLRWSGAEVRGKLVLELGAAPGGGTRALVEAGARVLAVDPQPLRADVLALPGVTHLARAIGDVPLEAIPSEVRWLACDAGIRPADVVGAIKRLLPRLPVLEGLLLTLKLLDDGTIRGLPRTFRDLEALGFADVQGRQLAANRRDIFVVARRGKATQGATKPPRRPSAPKPRAPAPPTPDASPDKRRR